MIAQANQLKEDRWILVRGPDVFNRQVSTHQDYEAMFADLVPWARAYAWQHDHKPWGNPIAKQLRRRPQ